MKLSVSAWSVQRDLRAKKSNLYEFIDFCRDNGVDAVELLDCFWDNEAQVQKIKDYLVKVNMPVAAYSIGNDFVKDDAGRKAEVEYVKKGIDTAVRLGTKILRVFSGEEKEGIPFEQAKVWIIDCFKECAAYAEEKGIVMALENHGLFAGKSSQVKEIIDAVNSSSLRANADVGNFLLVDEDSLEAVKNLKDYIAFVHFKDFKQVTENGRYTTASGKMYVGEVIGQGDVKLKEIVDFLYESGYNGYLSLEFEGAGEPYKGTLESLQFAKSVIR